jgi:putative glutamine amidotransferase
MRPVILLTGATGTLKNGTPTHVLNQDYANAVLAAGGLPLLAVDSAGAEEYARAADGLLLTGGRDLNPALYGQTGRYESVLWDDQRDGIEMPILRAFVECKKPVMGICRGIQLLNVFFGGTLIQDIPDQLGGNHADGVCHPVRALADSVPGRLFGTELMTNSYHHQVIERLGDGLRATAWSKVDNGEIIEAVEHEALPIFAVQWHPERMVGPAPVSPGCTAMEPLFAELIRRAAQMHG